MGTWSAPDTAAKKAKLKKVANKLKKVLVELNPLFGDDMVFDDIHAAIDRINEAIAHKWSSPTKESKKSSKIIQNAQKQFRCKL